MADRNYITTGREAGSNSLHGECFSASYPARSQAHLVAFWCFCDKLSRTRRPLRFAVVTARLDT
jgi:hypothetical protein